MKLAQPSVAARPFALRAAAPLAALLLGVALHLPAAARGLPVNTEQGQIRVVEVARGLDSPWGLAFLPDGRLLVSERPGRLRIVAADGSVSKPIEGVPEVRARGQGGLLDVVLSPDFATDRTIVFSFAQATANGGRSAVARARLDLDALRLDDVQVIFAQNESGTSNNHWGSRLVFDREGKLFATFGDRQDMRSRVLALDSHIGKIIRINPDGSVPEDNPFVGRAGAQPEVWSYGHRNVQGAALHPVTGELWAHEHGPMGGDELNRVLPGRNYGWPEITFGREYGIGSRIGEGTSRDDVEAPVVQWTPSIAPSGMAFYTGDKFPQWKGNVFVGALKFQLLVRVVLEGDKVVHQERMLTELGSRIRDVRQGPDGNLWLLDESRGRVLRVEPS